MLDHQLLNIVDQYIQKTINLEDLENWLVPRLPLFFKAPYSEASEMVAEIEVALADMSEQRLTEGEFRALLKNLGEQVQIVWANYPAQREIAYSESNNQASPTIQYAIPELVSTQA